MNKRTLSEIWIYPVKSLGGIRLTSAKVFEKGLQFDRRWMLVDENGRFLTQRALPRMALFSLSQVNEGFQVKYGKDSILLSATRGNGNLIKGQVWNDEVEVIEAPAEFNRWFSERIGIACRLVSFPEEKPRLIDAKYRLSNENVSLADGYPVLIIGQVSLDDLNSRLDTPVTMRRFRPNLIFTGGLPYEEDQWRNFHIGDSAFVGVKPCGRCVLTTVDPQTGETGQEPLLTLSRYRRQNDRINFGQNAIPIKFHEIHEGDEICIE